MGPQAHVGLVPLVQLEQASHDGHGPVGVAVEGAHAPRPRGVGLEPAVLRGAAARATSGPTGGGTGGGGAGGGGTGGGGSQGWSCWSSVAELRLKAPTLKPPDKRVWARASGPQGSRPAQAAPPLVQPLPEVKEAGVAVAVARCRGPNTCPGTGTLTGMGMASVWVGEMVTVGAASGAEVAAAGASAGA
jgi:hypothetical protein